MTSFAQANKIKNFAGLLEILVAAMMGIQASSMFSPLKL
jgi:hypothetical protein